MTPVRSLLCVPALFLLFLLALLASTSAHAEVVDLYTGTAPVASQDEAERARARCVQPSFRHWCAPRAIPP